MLDPNLGAHWQRAGAHKVPKMGTMVPILLGLWPPATFVPINGHHGAHWVAYGVNFSPSHGQDYYGHAVPNMGSTPTGSHAWALPCPFLACFVGAALPEIGTEKP